MGSNSSSNPEDITIIEKRPPINLFAGYKLPKWEQRLGHVGGIFYRFAMRTPKVAH